MAPIVTYHRFSERADGHALSAAAFAEQLSYLTARYNIVPLRHLVDCIACGKTLPPRALAITIDDGYRDFYDIAFPLLRRFQLPATVFLVSDFMDRRAWIWPDKLRFITEQTDASELMATVGRRKFHVHFSDRASRRQIAWEINSELKTLPDAVKEEAIAKIARLLRVDVPDVPPPPFSALTWDQVHELHQCGIDVGSHTVTHPILTRVDPARVEYEARISKSRLEAELGCEIQAFCFPNGAFSERIQQEIARAGYKCAVTDRYGLNRSDSPLLELRRVHTEPDMPHFAQGTSGFDLLKLRMRSLTRN